MKDPIATLSALIARKGLSQSELARRAGVSRPGLNRILSGKQDPTLSVYMRILEAARGAKGRGRAVEAATIAHAASKSHKAGNCALPSPLAPGASTGVCAGGTADRPSP